MGSARTVFINKGRRSQKRCRTSIFQWHRTKQSSGSWYVWTARMLGTLLQDVSKMKQSQVFSRSLFRTSSWIRPRPLSCVHFVVIINQLQPGCSWVIRIRILLPFSITFGYDLPEYINWIFKTVLIYITFCFHTQTCHICISFVMVLVKITAQKFFNLCFPDGMLRSIFSSEYNILHFSMWLLYLHPSFSPCNSDLFLGLGKHTQECMDNNQRSSSLPPIELRILRVLEFGLGLLQNKRLLFGRRIRFFLCRI